MSKDNALEALQFYLDNDLDEILSEDLVDHFSAKEVEPKLEVSVKKQIPQKIEAIKKAVKKDVVPLIKPEFSTNNALSKLAKQFTQDPKNSGDSSISIIAIIERAKKAAQNAKTLEELKEAVENFDGCNLKKMATNTVFADGNKDSEVMIIGEAPGNDEDLQGIPFCGEPGKMLDQMLAAIKMSRAENVYISNIIFWRPPGNRKPTAEELAICRPFVERHIELLDPKILVLVGSTAMNAILGISTPISKVRGEFMDFSPDFLSKTIKTFTIFHPSYLIKQSSKKRIAWQDLQALEQFIKDN